MKLTPIALALAFTACSHTKSPPEKPRPAALDAAFAARLAAVRVRRDHPIVDMHMHAFNGRYFPMKRILAARKWSAGLWYVPGCLLDVGVALIVSSTPRGFTHARSDDVLRARLKKTGDLSEVDRLEAMLAVPEENLRFSLGALFSGDGEAMLVGPMGQLAYALGVRRWAVRTVTKTFMESEGGGEGHGETLPAGEQAARFAVRLMSSEAEQWRHIQTDHPRVDLYVCHLLDADPSFGARRDGEEAYAIAQRHDRARRLCALSKGRMVHFAGWNPFRADSLEVVHEAVRKGAAGVKFYPPIGYRAAGNNVKAAPRPQFLGLLDNEASRQWDARYKGRTGPEIDAMNERLFAWCEREGVPIFTHCHTGEFRVYGEDVYAAMSSPFHWEKVLECHPKLRLCFGHAGGVADWYGEEKKPKTERDRMFYGWGEKVRALCLKYPNVYLEFGIHEAAAHTGESRKLFEKLKIEMPKRGSGGWQLADKMMYGSDWFMPVDVEPRKYLEAFERLFTVDGRAGLEAYKERFFHRNAARFLNRTVGNRF